MRWWIFGACIILLAPGGVLAQVVINEIAWMGIPVDGVDAKQWWRYEFLELYNAGEQEVSLQGWKVELRNGEILEFTILLHGVLPVKEYFLVGASDKIPGLNVNYATLSGKLKNSGQRVVLKDAAGLVVEEIDTQQGRSDSEESSDSKSWFAGDNDLKLTMERRFFDREAADPENWGSSQDAGGTPKAQNSVFGKEAFLKLDSVEQKQDLAKKDPLWSSFFQTIIDTVFIRSFLVALLSAVGVLLLRRYLLRSPSPSEDSSDALRD
ncbi:MAG TPA: lamin tail domain-containing protein [Candidatus Paceibacterota bacterium]